VIIAEQSLTVASAGVAQVIHRLRNLIKCALITLIVPILLALVLGESLGLVRILNDPHIAANKDFVSYWAAGKLLVAHRNPYDSQAVQAIEKAAGYLPDKGITMRNAPPALLLVLPLGLFGIKWAAFLWTLLIVVSIVVTVHLVWAMHGRPPNKIHLLGFVFPAALSCVSAGQTSAFAVMGIALFLYLYGTRPFLAGLSLGLCAIKPHLFLPFGAVLLLWVLINRLWPVIWGAFAALAASMAVATSFHQGLWSEYFLLLQTDVPEHDFLPAASSLLRLAVNRNEMWLQFLPSVLGVAWAVWYFRRHHADWDWRTNGLLLLMVSFLVAPYSWFFDQIVLIPAILHGIYAVNNQQRSGFGFGVISCVAGAQMLFAVPIWSGWYIWTSAAWLGWYVLETHQLPLLRPMWAKQAAVSLEGSES
jgi:hypothetical protein